ncbi:MAG: pilin [Patescibacteria group bacterium]|nr:pilin [Patescibacteria group bacterium]
MANVGSFLTRCRWLIAVIAVVFPTAVLAAGASVQLPNPLGNVVDPRVLVGQVIGAVLGIVGSLALAMFIYGGFLWMTSAGNTERVTKGKNVILWASFGLAVIFSAYILVIQVLGAIAPKKQTLPTPGGSSTLSTP